MTTHWSITWGKPKNQLRCVTSFGLFFAGVQGLEPRIIVLETIVLPITLHSQMEPVVGFKPTTYALQVRCSIN